MWGGSTKRGAMSYNAKAAFLPATLLSIVVLATIVVATSDYLANKRVEAQNAGLDQAKSDVLIMRRRFNETLKRVSLLETSGVLVEHSYSHHLLDFPERLDSLRQQIDIAGSEFASVSFVNAVGDLQWSTHWLPSENINVADRDYFEILAKKDVEIVVGNTSIGKVTSLLSLPFAFKIHDFNGNFKGVLVIRVAGDFTRTLLQSVEYKTNSMVSLVRGGGQYLGRSVNTPSGVISSNARFLPTIGTKSISDTNSTAISVSPIDGVERFMATSYNSQWDVILVVGNDTAPMKAVLAGVTRSIVIIAAALGFGAMALILIITRLSIERRNNAKNLRVARDVARREGVLVQVAEKATDMIALMDAEFRYLYANDAFRRQLGIDPKQSIGKRMGHSNVYKPEVEAGMARIARDGGSARVLVDIFDAIGRTRWLEIELVAVDIRKDDYVAPCRYISIARDVTERVLAEQKVAVSQMRLENILRVGPGVAFEVWFGPNNETFIELPVGVPDRLLGYSVEEATRNGLLFDQTDPSDVEARRLAKYRCLTTGWASVEFNAQAKDGSTHRMLNQLRRATGAHSGAAIIGYMTDITSDYVSRTRLRHSEQLAILGLASANIAHDMIQPLGSLMLSVENAVAAVESGKATSEYTIGKLARIGEQATRLAQMVDRVRRFSRVDQGNKTVFQLAFAIEEAIALAEMRMRTVGMQVQVDLPPDLPELHTDRLLLEQVLLNLIINACDAYQGQQPPIESANRVLAISAEITNEALVIYLADRAGGILPVILPKLFKAFTTTKPADIGTGLGLTICAGNIRTLGGTIAARNQNGGAVFELVLPLAVMRSFADA